MTEEEIQYTEAEAINLLTAVFGSIAGIKLPLDLSRVLDYCGLTLREGTFESDELAGALDRESKTIFIESSDSFVRKNFTIAHELGHFRLHNDVKTDIFTRQQAHGREGGKRDMHELLANRFAGSLLMPEVLVQQLWDVSKDVDKLAQIFGVSPEAMTRRLRHLKLLDDPQLDGAYAQA